MKGTIKAVKNLDLKNYKNDILDYKVYSNKYLPGESIWQVGNTKIEKEGAIRSSP